MEGFKESWKLWKVFPYLFNADVPVGMKAGYLMVSWGYAFLPVDVVPDVLLGIGQVDDVTVGMMLTGGFIAAADAHLSRLALQDPMARRIHAQARAVYGVSFIGMVAVVMATSLPFLTEFIGVFVVSWAIKFGFIQWKEHTLLLDMPEKPKRHLPPEDAD